MATFEEFLRQGIVAARAGQTDIARRLLAQALQIDSRSETAWLWMSGVMEARDERIYCLRRVLDINPGHEIAKRGLRSLGATGELKPPEPEPAPQSAPPREAPGGVPIPEAQTLSRALSKLDPIINEAFSWAEMGELDVQWTRGLRPPRRALPQITPAILNLLIGVLGAVAFLTFGAAIYRMIQNARVQADVTPVPTATITVTPSPAPTARPTRTPTMSPGPSEMTFTPGPTMPVMAPRGDLSMGLTETPPYIATQHPGNQEMDDAIELFHEGDYTEAIEAIRTARDAGPDAVDSYYYEGISLIYLGESEEAEDVFDAGLDIDSEFAPLHAGLGHAYLLQGAINRAQTAAERAKELDPEFIGGYLASAAIYRSEGEIELALTEIDAALAISPYNVEVLVAQGQTLLVGGQSDRAAAVGNLAVYIDPSAEAANVLLAEARIALGQPLQAAVLLEEYVQEINPESADAWAMLGRAYHGEGNSAAAMDTYGWALILDSDNVNALAALGELSLANGDYVSAYDYFDRALDLRDDPTAQVGRAESAFAMGDYRQARNDIEPLYEQRPDDAQAALLYARTLLEDEDSEEAISVIDALLALPLSETERGFAYEVRGCSHYRREDYENALADIEAAMLIARTGTRHYYHALIREANGDLRGAMLELEWVLFWSQIYDYPFADDAAERRDNLADTLEEIRTMTPTPWPTWTPSPPAEESAPPEGGEAGEQSAP